MPAGEREDRRRDGGVARVAGAAARSAHDRGVANAEFFSGCAEPLARLCDEMAVRFLAGGRLLALGVSGAARSDAHHVAVEFVHPVIVGKRALPALAVEDLASEAEPGDIVIAFDGDAAPARSLGCLMIEGFEPPVADPFIRQELTETLYHVLWELVHVFIEHRERRGHDAGASSFLYPFLGESAQSLEGVVEDVRRSILAKADEIGALREQTLTENDLIAPAEAIRSAGRVLALGNGGAATDAMDVVADLRARGRRALDLTSDPAVLTAIANDIGVEAIFARQVIAHGREDDVLITISTSGNSDNVIAALIEARRRRIVSIAFVGYGGGRILSEGAADHVIVTRSEHIPRIQEAQASAYHVLVEAATA